jgi:hypothetical protein
MTNLDLAQLRLLFFLFAGMAVVILIGLIAYVVVASRRRKAEDAPASNAVVVAPAAELPEAMQVMSLVRDEAGGRLQVEIEGARYRRLADVEDPEVKRRIVTTAMELIQFTGVLGEGISEPAPIEKTRTWREDLREGSHIELQRARTAPPSAGSPLQPPPDVHDIEARFLSLLAEMGQPSSRTFVDDIDDIVQRRLPLIPALAGRELHVRPGPGGKVRFSFEGQEYENVDDIPNLTARQLITDAIQEWDETT